MQEYGDSKTFIKYLNNNKYFEEIFYPIWKEENYPLLGITDFIVEGLNSSDSELNRETNKFLSKIMELLHHLISVMRNNSYAAYVLYFLYSVFNKTSQKEMSIFIEKLTEFDRDEFKETLQELLAKNKGVFSLKHEQKIGNEIINLISISQEKNKKDLKKKFTSGYLPDIEYLIINSHIELREIKSFIKNLDNIRGIADFFGDSDELKTNPPQFIRDSLKLIIEKIDETGLKELFENFLPYIPPERLLIPHSWESFIIENNFFNELSSEELSSLLENPELNLFLKIIKLLVSYEEEKDIDYYWLQEGICEILLEKSHDAVKNSIKNIFQNKNLDEIYLLIKIDYDLLALLSDINIEFLELVILSLKNRPVYYHGEFNALTSLINKIGTRSPENLLKLFKKSVEIQNTYILIELMESNVFKYLNPEDVFSYFENNNFTVFDVISNRLKILYDSMSNRSRTDEIDYELEFPKLKNISYHLQELCKNNETFKDFIIKNLKLTLESENLRSLAITLELGFLSFIEEIPIAKEQAYKIYRNLLKMFEFIDNDYFINNEFLYYAEENLSDILRNLIDKHKKYHLLFIRAILDSFLEDTPKSILINLNFTLNNKVENASLLDYVNHHDFEQIFKEYETSEFQTKIVEVIGYYMEDKYLIEMADRFIEIIARILLKISQVSQINFSKLLDRIIELMPDSVKKEFKELLVIAIRFGYSDNKLYVLKEFVIEIFELVNKDSLVQAQYVTYGEDKLIIYDSVLEYECRSDEDKTIKFDMFQLQNFKLVKNLKKIKIWGNVKKIDGLMFHHDLEELDLGSTGLTEIHGLEKLPNLKILKLERNKISKIKGLEDLESLEYLDLTYNKIKIIEGLENLKKLEFLKLMGNQISEIKGLDNLINLKKLFINSNNIEFIKGLEPLTGLEELDLGYNKIRKIQGLENLVNLKRIHLMDNQIAKLKTRSLRDKNFPTAQDYVVFCQKSKKGYK